MSESHCGDVRNDNYRTAVMLQCESGEQSRKSSSTSKEKNSAILQSQKLCQELVDRRYRQYYHQMQIVVSSFDVIAGCGAAKPYTALALETISRHFRCLRDAISGQYYHQMQSVVRLRDAISGLASPLYTHFTSPIRRYADVIVHRLLAAALGISKLPPIFQDRPQLTSISDRLRLFSGLKRKPEVEWSYSYSSAEPLVNCKRNKPIEVADKPVDCEAKSQGNSTDDQMEIVKHGGLLGSPRNSACAVERSLSEGFAGLLSTGSCKQFDVMNNSFQSH